jgi:nitrite reductase/ring-hydroxylating ferredoxin subunit
MEILIGQEDLPLTGDYKYFDYPELKQEILVANIDGQYKVFSSFCPHFGGKLEIKDGDLYCYFHDYKFDIESGKCQNKSLGTHCKSLSFFEDDDGLMVEVE